MDAEVIGIDHIYLTVSDLEASERFYDGLLGEVLGFRKAAFSLSGERHVHYYNRLFGVVLRPARGTGRPFDAYAVGLHHLCLRVDDAAAVDRVAAALGRLSISASPARLHPEYAPDYYALFVSDPDGVRLEVTNFRAERRARMEAWDLD